MLKNKLKNYMAKHEDGFTIIEVIIVLVIGAVIMLAVFLVVPQLQRQQRNTRRQADARRVLAAAEQFAANNGGTYPASSTTGNAACSTKLNSASCKPIIDIIGDLKSPSGSEYTISGTENVDNMNITWNNGSCSNTNSLESPFKSNKFNVTVFLENTTSTPTTWCVGN